MSAVAQTPLAPEDFVRRVSQISERVIAKTAATTARDPEIPEFDELRTPDSPAFVLLGGAPTQIQRPSTSKALSTQITSALQDGLVVPDDFAIEISPYWMLPHKPRYLGDYDEENWLRTFYEEATVSIGTLTVGTSADATTMGAVGFRTRLYQRGKAPECIAQIESLTGRSNALITEITNEAERLALASFPDEDLREAMISSAHTIAVQAVNSTEEKLGEQLSELTATCAEQIFATKTWNLDLSAANSWTFPGGQFENGVTNTLAGSLTGSYTTSGFSLVVLARMLRMQTDDDPELGLDTGASVVLARENYAATGEFVQRRIFREQDPDRYRVALGAEYEVKDGVWLNVSLGKDFSTGEERSVFAVANLKWNLGSRQLTADHPE